MASEDTERLKRLCDAATQVPWSDETQGTKVGEACKKKGDEVSKKREATKLLEATKRGEGMKKANGTKSDEGFTNSDGKKGEATTKGDEGSKTSDGMKKGETTTEGDEGSKKSSGTKKDDEGFNSEATKRWDEAALIGSPTKPPIHQATQCIHPTTNQPSHHTSTPAGRQQPDREVQEAAHHERQLEF